MQAAINSGKILKQTTSCHLQGPRKNVQENRFGEDDQVDELYEAVSVQLYNWLEKQADEPPVSLDTLLSPSNRHKGQDGVVDLPSCLLGVSFWTNSCLFHWLLFHYSSGQLATSQRRVFIQI